jgi:methylenetetrahydrofolate reductase (NADPH)
MRITDLIRENGKSLSFQFFPPRTPLGEDRLMERINRLKAFSPSFVSVTQHAGAGTFERTRHMAGKIHDTAAITVMPHITCADPRRMELAQVMQHYAGSGTENILAVRGDPGEYGPGVFDGVLHYRYAAELVEFIAGFKQFCIGVAVYPEGHPESPNLGLDTANTKRKIEQGAHFGITQMFFENFYYYEMMDRFLQDGITIPVIAGIMPITDYQKVEHLAELGGVEIPVQLVNMFEELESPDDVMKAGVDHATEQCLDLWDNGVRCFHFYTLNRDEAVTQILRNLEPTFRANG